MLQQESIYNLVPKLEVRHGRGESYHSRYPPDIAPTASTFILKNSSFPGVANMSGEYKLPRGAHPILRNSATFGLPLGSYAADPHNFHKKGETHKIIPKPEKFHTASSVKKPPIPTVNDTPIFGLKTSKNFIIANAVDNILMQPKKITNDTDRPFHRYYGKVPDYIKKYRLKHENELNDLKEIRRKHQEEEDAKQRLLTEAEVSALREGLKKKWEFYNNKYTGLTHKKVYDNIVLLRK
jgi:hypothetical protein